MPKPVVYLHLPHETLAGPSGLEVVLPDAGVLSIEEARQFADDLVRACDAFERLKQHGR
jgi:hypothetical protein